MPFFVQRNGESGFAKVETGTSPSSLECVVSVLGWSALIPLDPWTEPVELRHTMNRPPDAEPYRLERKPGC